MDRKVKPRAPALKRPAATVITLRLPQEVVTALALLDGAGPLGSKADRARWALTYAATVFRLGIEKRGWEHDATIHIFGDDWIPKLPNKCQWCKAPFPDERERYPIRQCCARGNEADLRAMAKR